MTLEGSIARIEETHDHVHPYEELELGTVLQFWLAMTPETLAAYGDAVAAVHPLADYKLHAIEEVEAALSKSYATTLTCEICAQYGKDSCAKHGPFPKRAAVTA